MAYPRFYVNKVDLAKCLVTQNEKGNYWLKNGALARFILSEFEKAHTGCVMKSDGSHVPYTNTEHPLDFSVLGDLTSDQSMKLNGMFYIKGYKVPYGLDWVWGNHHIITYHTKTTWKVGDRVPAGKVMCTVMTPAENKASGRFDKQNPKGFPSHLHIGTNTSGTFEKTTIRQMILEVPPPVVVPPVAPPVTPPAPNSPEQPHTDPKDEQIKALLAEKAQWEKERLVYESMVNDRNTKITELETKYNDAQQNYDKCYMDVCLITQILCVNAYGKTPLGKLPPLLYDIKQPWEEQHYKYEGAVATIQANSLVNSSMIQLLQAMLNKFITKKTA